MEEIATLIVATLQGQMMLLPHTHASTLTLNLIIPDPQENDNSDISGHVGTERQRGNTGRRRLAPHTLKTKSRDCNL
ncbi:hypothetical protein F2Q68_00041370 [Brassica cretica]|uniref:Uncharacterized protein n=1 Tax=Brassica cretica TaxID=69181 RepID=A0A8S9M9I4_BRACR|nr:hypothetical protein F2Q68_00041370 [Brassica cretica]